jgi:hypothetical protein
MTKIGKFGLFHVKNYLLCPKFISILTKLV